MTESRWKVWALKPWLPGAAGALAAIGFGFADGLVWHRLPLDAKAGDPSVWQILFGSPIVLGFVRVSIVALSIYLFASMVALATSGRWITRVGTVGMEVGETLRKCDSEIHALQQTVMALRAERDAALVQAREAIEIAEQVLGDDG